MFGRPRKRTLAARKSRISKTSSCGGWSSSSAKHDLPFQIHTGQARIQGSNPMLLVDLIEANPKTKFVLFHGGFPWVGETGVIAMRFRNVWIDSCWLPTLSYTMAKRAYQEWLEVCPRTESCGAPTPARPRGSTGPPSSPASAWPKPWPRRSIRGELREEHALRIGRQIMRDNAPGAVSFPPETRCAVRCRVKRGWHAP